MVRALYDPQSSQYMDNTAAGFPHYAERYRLGGTPLSSLGCQSCEDMGNYMNRRWDPFLSDWCCLYVGTPANQRSTGVLGFPHFAGRYQPGGCLFVSPGCRSYRCVEDLIQGREPFSLDDAGSVYEPQPISYQPIGLGFLYSAGRCRSEGSSLSFMGCCN